MMATRWEPLVEMQRLSQEMDRLFGSQSNRVRPSNHAYPAVNMWEDDDRVFVQAELPGYSLDQIEVFLQGQELTLKGKREMPSQDAGKWHRREREAREFQRVIKLSQDVKDADMSAEYRHGVLTVRLQKCEAAKPIRIEIQSS